MAHPFDVKSDRRCMGGNGGEILNHAPVQLVRGTLSRLQKKSVAWARKMANEYNIKLGLRTRESPLGLITEHDFYQDISGLVDFLAANYGKRLAFGCVTSNKELQDDIESTDFEELRSLSVRAASYFQSQAREAGHSTGWVALVATSSLNFLVAWLGLVRAGRKVLLTAPQSSPEAVKHLFQTASVTTVFYDERNYDLVRTANSLLPGSVDCIQLPLLSSLSSSTCMDPIPKPMPTDEAFAFHSSGTTGLPKLVPQTHHGAVGILPLLQDPAEVPVGTFSTTPLYHGGIADVLRSWSAASPLWLFPEGKLPVTGTNVMRIVDVIDALPGTPRLGYLSCVPFVLESFTTVPKRLRQFDAVGVGGAAMPRKLGDALVSEGVRLVSRFGSAENGFLLSSERNYNTDKNWQVLRPSDLLNFKAVGNGTFELYVPTEWPLVSTAKHAGRPFSTKDLFASDGEGWIYQGRSDAQLALVTGKKFDPELTESHLKESDFIDDAIVVGEGRPVPGALLFSSREENDLHLRDVLDQVNFKVERHARLAVDNILVLALNQTARIRRNNKGGLIRSAIYGEFESEIDALYSGIEKTASHKALDKQTIFKEVNNAVSASRDDIHPDDDLFEAGLDSASCVAICQRLKSSLGARLDLSAVYECGTINALTRFISEEGKELNLATEERTWQRMRETVEYYVREQPLLMQEIANKPRQHEYLGGRSVVLTGGTGFLGAHVLGQLLSDPETARVYTLVRGSRLMGVEEQIQSANARLIKALSYHRLDTTSFQAKVRAVPFLLNERDLGLEKIPSRIDEIIHAAWQVDFLLPFKSFDKHVQASVQLWNIARLSSHPCRYNFKSSIAAENSGPSGSGGTGYGQSKWVCESVLERFERGQVSLSIDRVGQLSGAVTTGVWNRREAWPLMFEASLKHIGSLPGIQGNVCWQPVDRRGCPFRASWSQIMELAAATWHITVIDPELWLDKVEQADIRAGVLVPMWRMGWNSDAPAESPPANVLDEAYLKRILRWISEDSTT